MESDKVQFLAKIRDFSLVFWPLVFPLALTTAMYFSIGQMDESDFEIIPVAVVSQNTEMRSFSKYLKTVEENDNALIDVRSMTEKRQ